MEDGLRESNDLLKLADMLSRDKDLPRDQVRRIQEAIVRGAEYPEQPLLEEDRKETEARLKDVLGKLKQLQDTIREEEVLNGEEQAEVRKILHKMNQSPEKKREKRQVPAGPPPQQQQQQQQPLNLLMPGVPQQQQQQQQPFQPAAAVMSGMPPISAAVKSDGSPASNTTAGADTQNVLGLGQQPVINNNKGKSATSSSAVGVITLLGGAGASGPTAATTKSIGVLGIGNKNGTAAATYSTSIVLSNNGTTNTTAQPGSLGMTSNNNNTNNNGSSNPLVPIGLTNPADKKEAQLEAAPKGVVLKVISKGESNLKVGQLVNGNLDPIPSPISGLSNNTFQSNMPGKLSVNKTLGVATTTTKTTVNNNNATSSNETLGGSILNFLGLSPAGTNASAPASNIPSSGVTTAKPVTAVLLGGVTSSAVNNNISIVTKSPNNTSILAAAVPSNSTLKPLVTTSAMNGNSSGAKTNPKPNASPAASSRVILQPQQNPRILPESSAVVMGGQPQQQQQQQQQQQPPSLLMPTLLQPKQQQQPLLLTEPQRQNKAELSLFSDRDRADRVMQEKQTGGGADRHQEDSLFSSLHLTEDDSNKNELGLINPMFQ